MKGSRRGGAAHSFLRSGIVDLGNEPPLSAARDDVAHLRRSVSLRWLSGTILTGLTSSLLIGGALFAAIDERHQIATPASASVLGQMASVREDFAGKGDRIQPIIQAPASRQVIEVATATRQDDRDLIRQRPFARISAGLSMPTEAEAEAIPPYDPLRVFAAVEEPAVATPVASDQIYGAFVDGEIAIKVIDFPLGDPIAAVPVIASADVEAIVRGAATSLSAGGATTLAYVDTEQFGGAGSPFSALGVSIVPENVTLLARTDVGGPSRSEQITTLQEGETFAALLARSEIGGGDADAITAALNTLIDLAALRPGERVRIGLVPGDLGEQARPSRVSIYDNGVHQATVARTDADLFVRADEPIAIPEVAAANTGDAAVPVSSGPMPRLYEAIYQTALDQQVPPDLIPELIRLLSYEVDFQSRISPGDSIEIFHSIPDAPDETGLDQEILYASITLGGVTKRFYRFATADDGYLDYYDEDGNSAKKFLLRKPITSGIFRSGFGYRRHPILGYSKLHSGVDYAAATGTPVLAAGDGVVEEAEWSSGYGRYTIIRHANGYETAYAHQSAFANGVVPGASVRQGQIIGYVGTSGLTTGPHLHFEVKVNGTFVDPLRIRLPRGRTLDGDMLASFEQERARIDALIGAPVPPTRLAAAQ